MIKSEVVQHPKETRVLAASAMSQINIADYATAKAFLLQLDYLWHKLQEGVAGSIPDGLYANFLLMALERGGASGHIAWRNCARENSRPWRRHARLTDH